MNTERNPCEESEDYKYFNCIIKRIMSIIGCRPYWLPFIRTELDNCTDASKVDEFLKLMSKVEDIPNEKELFAEYKCLKPCNFMEYKVSNKDEKQSFLSCSDFKRIFREPLIPIY